MTFEVTIKHGSFPFFNKAVVVQLSKDESYWMIWLTEEGEQPIKLELPPGVSKFALTVH